jgi:integrase
LGRTRISSHDRTFGEIGQLYLTNKEWKKESTKALHSQIVGKVLIPRWGNRVAVEIRPKEVKDWLKSLSCLTDATRYKYKTIMGTVFAWAIAEELLPSLVTQQDGTVESTNPIPRVKGIEGSSDFEAVILAPKQTITALEFLELPERTLVILIAATGLRSSEALGLKWQDVLFEKNEIAVGRQTYVYGRIQRGAKTKKSRACVPLHPLLAEALQAWRLETPYSKPEDFIFASSKLGGRKPRSASMIVRDYLKPAAIKARVLTVKDGKTFASDGQDITRFRFHNFRHSLASFLMSNGEDPKLVQTLLRHSKMDMTLHYTHSTKEACLMAQGKLLQQLVPNDRVQDRVLISDAPDEAAGSR